MKDVPHQPQIQSMQSKVAANIGKPPPPIVLEAPKPKVFFNKFSLGKE